MEYDVPIIDEVTAQLWAYRESFGEPKNFSEGTEAFSQWTYSPRKKNAKKVIENSKET